MSKPVQKLQAVKLRKQGKTIPEIARMLQVSKGSVSLWTKEVTLSKKAQNILYQNKIKGSYKGRLAGALLNKNKKIQIQNLLKQEALDNLSAISERDLLIFGVGLFWGEGNKNGSKFIFSNSDSSMLLLIIDWLIKCFDVERKDIFISIQINKIHKDRKDEIIEYWSKTLLIDKTDIRGPYFINSNSKKIYENSKKYYGTIKIQVKKSSILQYKILGYIRVLQEKYMPR